MITNDRANLNKNGHEKRVYSSEINFVKNELFKHNYFEIMFVEVKHMDFDVNFTMNLWSFRKFPIFCTDLLGKKSKFFSQSLAYPPGIAMTFTEISH